MVELKENEFYIKGPCDWRKAGELDESGYPIEISHDHHKIHEGEFYIVDSIDGDVDIASPKIWTFVTPNNNSRIHIYFLGAASGAGTFALYEDASVTANGSTISPINLNRNSSREAEMLFYEDSTIDDIGTFLMGVFVGTPGVGLTRIGGSGARTSEMILKKNTRYAVRFTPVSDNTKVSISFKWYEVNYPKT